MSRIYIHRGILSSIALHLLAFLPQVAQKWVKSTFPEWFLPSTIICKKQKEGWAEEFENEKAMYAKLRDLQGVVVPKYYGQVTCADDRPVLLFSGIGGDALCEPATAGISEGRLRELLTNAYDSMAFYNIAHTDAKLDNFILVGDRIMVVDLEMAEE